MAVKPVLGDWEIPRVDVMRTAEARKFAELAIPGRQGSVFQDLNAEPTVIEIGGSLFADEERSDFLTKVREKFRAGAPATFVADITQATDIQFVVIDTMRFEQRADRPDEIFYNLTLRESPPPPPPPDPLGGIDAGLLDAAAGFVDGVTGALDALAALANLPDFSDPSAVLGGTLDKVGSALGGLGDVTSSIQKLFTPDMASVIERLSSSVSSDGLTAQLTSQTGALQQAISLAGQLIDGKTPGITTFINALGALRSPTFNTDGTPGGNAGGGVGAALGSATALVPTDLASVIAPVSGQIASMATLIEERLKPLLQDAVQTAQSIQQLLNLQLGCSDGVAGSVAGSNGNVGAPPPPGQPAPPTRIAVATQQLAQVDTLLNALPNPIDAGALLQLLLMLLGSKPRDRFFALNLPVVDDLIDPLQTLARWTALDANGVAVHMTLSIDTLTARLRESAALPLAALGTALNTSAPLWRSAALGAAADAVSAALTAVDTALQAADAAATTAALTTLNAALDAYDTLRVAMTGDVLATAPALRGQLLLTPTTLLDNLTHLLVLLAPTNLAARLSDLAPRFEPVSAAAIDAVRGAIQPLIDWLRDLIVQLDFSAAQAEIATVATTAQGLANDIAAALTGVALEVQGAFAQVGDAIGSTGLTDLRNELTAQISQFGTQLQRDVAQAFAPARDATNTAISAVSGALDAFDPAALVAALQSVIDSIAGVLNGADVKDAINAVKQALDAVVAALKSLSFAPVTAEVVALIEAMKKGLQAIIANDLNDATKAALGAAMGLLPNDLHPATDPLVAGFGELVQSGPLVVLASVKDAPQQLLSQIKQFNPAALVGDALSAPYRTLLDRANGFKVAQLLAPAEAELAKARQRLVQAASPGRALEPLRAPVQQLLAKVDAFKPSALLTPLTKSVEDTVAKVIAASPVDEILGAINGVFDTIRDFLAFVQRIQSVADRIGQVFAALTNADAQLNTWRDSLLAKVASGPNPALQTALTGLNAALDGARHADALAAFDVATSALRTALDALDPAARLNRIVNAYGRLTTRVPGLPASAARDALQQVLTRFNPGQPLHAAPLRVADGLRSAVSASRAEIVALTGDWNDTVAGFAELRDVALSSLPALVAAALDQVLQPVRFIFTSLGNLAAPVNAVVQALAEVVTTLTARLDALVSGPGSLSAISGAVQNIVDVLRGIDLGFVGRGLDEVLGSVRDQLRALDPTQLADELNKAFEQALSGLSLSALIPPNEVAALDTAWQAVITKLTALDPAKLVEQTLQPLFDSTVLPLLDAFDLTPVFTALIEFLESMAGELDTGLDQVNSAYQSFIALRPGGGASASVSVGGGG